MHAFDVLGDPVRRRILELLGDRELTSGAEPSPASRMVITLQRELAERLCAKHDTSEYGALTVLIPAKVCVGGRPFSCSATGTTSASRFDLCDGRITAG